MRKRLIAAVIIIAMFLTAGLNIHAEETAETVCSVSADLRTLTLRTYTEQTSKGFSYVLGDDSLEAEYAYDGAYTVSIDIPENCAGTEIKVKGVKDGTTVSATTVVIPALDVSGDKRIENLSITVAKGVTLRPQTIAGYEYFILPSGTNLGKLTFSFPEEITDVTVSDALSDGESIEVTSGETTDIGKIDFYPFCDGRFLKIQYKKNGDNQQYTVGLLVSGNIGSVFFESSDPENMGRSFVEASPDHSAKAAGKITLFNSSLEKEYSGDVSAIKGRGNTTWWGTDKKSYQIKLNKKADLLDPENGTQKAKKWILLANPFDGTLMKNQLLFELAYRMGLTSTPEGRQVDLYYDGEYRGTYFLCEKVESGTGRVEIEDLEGAIEDANPDVDLEDLPEEDGTNSKGDHIHYVTGINDPEDISGGYILELDKAYYTKEKTYFECGIFPFVLKEPEVLSETAVTYISEFVDDIYRCFEARGVHPETGQSVLDLIDLDSFVRYFVVELWSKNIDFLASSTFFYKPAGEDILYAGPLWDCDAAFGGRTDDGLDKPDVSYINSWAKKWMSVPEFKEAVYRYYTSEFRGMVEDILYQEEGERCWTEAFKSLETAANINFLMWRAEDNPEIFERNEYYWQNVTYLLKWAKTRTEWIDRKVATPDLTAVYNSAFGADLRWDVQKDVKQYTIMRKENGIWKSIAALDADSLEKADGQYRYIDSEIKNSYGKGYIYSVATVDTYGNELYDSLGLPLYRLEKPAFSSISVADGTKAEITWGKVDAHGYQVQYSSDGGKTWTVTEDITETKTVIDGLDKDKTYVFRMRCYKDNPDRGRTYSQYSDWGRDGLVAKPVLRAIYNSAYGADIRWEPLGDVEQYTVMRKENGVWKEVVTVDVDDLEYDNGCCKYIDSEIASSYGKGFIYSVAVKTTEGLAYNTAGLPLYRLKQPKITSVEFIDQDTMKVQWSGTDCHGYELQYSTDGGKTWTKLPETTGTEATVSELNSESWYLYRVRCQKMNPDRGTTWSQYSGWAQLR